MSKQTTASYSGRQFMPRGETRTSLRAAAIERDIQRAERAARERQKEDAQAAARANGAVDTLALRRGWTPEYYDLVVTYARQHQEASIPFLQGYFPITRFQAKAMLEQMEADGIAGPEKADGTRDVYATQ